MMAREDERDRDGTVSTEVEREAARGEGGLGRPPVGVAPISLWETLGHFLGGQGALRHCQALLASYKAFNKRRWKGCFEVSIDHLVSAMMKCHFRRITVSLMADPSELTAIPQAASSIGSFASEQAINHGESVCRGRYLPHFWDVDRGWATVEPECLPSGPP